MRRTNAFPTVFLFALLVATSTRAATVEIAVVSAKPERLVYSLVISGHDAEGLEKVSPGAKVSLSGIGDLFNGRYYVAASRHSFSKESGYTSSFKLERNAKDARDEREQSEEKLYLSDYKIILSLDRDAGATVAKLEFVSGSKSKD